RGKDLALALHQLRAHLEEQRALQDLGTIVSEAEFMPTLRLANLEQLAVEASPGERKSTQVTPPEDRATEVMLTGAQPAPQGLTTTSTYNGDPFDTSPSLNMDPAAEEPPPPIVEAFSPPPDDLRTNIIPFDDFPPTPSSATPLPPLPPPPRGSSDIRPPLPPAARPMPDVPAPPRPSRSRPIPAESRPFAPERPRPSAAVPALPATA